MTKDDVIDFSIKIEELAIKNKMSYIDAIVMYCEKTGFELEVAAKLISANLKSKIRKEYESLNFLPKSTTIKLPLE